MDKGVLNLFLRILAGIIIFYSVFIFPWWVFVLLSLVFIFYFDFYVEAVFAGFVLDVLYGALSGLWSWFFVFAILSSLIFLLSFYIKGRVSFYSDEY